MFDWLLVLFPTRRELIRELRKTRMTNMAIRDELMDAIADLAVKIDALQGDHDVKCQARVDNVQAMADAAIAAETARYDHDMGAAKAKIDELRAKLGSFEDSNN